MSKTENAFRRYSDFTGEIDTSFVKYEVRNANFKIYADRIVWINGEWKDKNEWKDDSRFIWYDIDEYMHSINNSNIFLELGIDCGRIIYIVGHSIRVTLSDHPNNNRNIFVKNTPEGLNLFRLGITLYKEDKLAFIV